MSMHIKTEYRWQIPLWGLLFTGLLLIAEAASNALRAYSIGTHLEQFTVTAYGHTVSLAGVVLVLGAIGMSVALTTAAFKLFAPGTPRRQRWLCGLVGSLFFVVSVLALASHILEAQRFKISDEGGDRGKYDRALAAYNKAMGELKLLEGARTTEQVKAAMQTAKVGRNAFAWTEECTKFDGDLASLKKECTPILKLRVEMADAIRKADLEIGVSTLKADLDAIKRPEEISFLEAWSAEIWAIIFAASVSFGATCGPSIFARQVAYFPTFSGNLSGGNGGSDGLAGKVSAPKVNKEVAEVILAASRGPLNNGSMAAAMGVSDGEATKRVDMAAGYVDRRKEGREVEISLTKAGEAVLNQLLQIGAYATA